MPHISHQITLTLVDEDLNCSNKKNVAWGRYFVIKYPVIENHNQNLILVVALSPSFFTQKKKTRDKIEWHIEPKWSVSRFSTS